MSTSRPHSTFLSLSEAFCPPLFSSTKNRTVPLVGDPAGMSPIEPGVPSEPGSTSLEQPEKPARTSAPRESRSER